MNNSIKKLRKRVLELELAGVDESTKRVYLNAFERMTFSSDDSFDLYIKEAVEALGAKQKQSKATQEEVDEVLKNIML